MNGRVVFTNSIDDMLKEIAISRVNYRYLYYIYSKNDIDTNIMKMLLPEFVFISYDEIRDRHSDITDGDTTLYIVKNMRITKVPDPRLGFLQRSDGYKLVIDNHPFSENGKTYHLYFNYSLIAKSILGYPHCYAFDGAHETEMHRPYNPVMLAEKVKPYTTCYLDEIYNSIVYQKVLLTDSQMKEYEKLRDYLFDETEDGFHSIIRKLRKYTRQFLGKGFSLLNLSNVYRQYQKGVRTSYITDAKVDLYLKSEFERHINDVNTFIRTLNG